MIIKMTSGENGKHCDLLPFGSYHVVEPRDDGRLELINRNKDFVPPRFEYKEVESIPILLRRIINQMRIVDIHIAKPAKFNKICEHILRKADQLKAYNTNWSFENVQWCLRNKIMVL